MEEIQVLEELFDKKIISILKLLFADKTKEYYLQEISENSNVSMATCSRILAKLNKLEIIEIHMISRFKLYRLHDNKKVMFLSKLFKEDLKILHKFVEEIKSIESVKSVILHGKETKDKANILLIGTEIDPGKVKSVCARIKEKYDFLVSPLSLTPEQYMQMSQMGLYSGTKKLLFER